MKSTEYFNAPGAARQDSFGQFSAGSGDPDHEKWLAMLRRGALAGVGYTGWAVLDAYAQSGIDYTVADATAEAVFRIGLVMIPTALMFFRRGYVSGAALVLLAVTNSASMLQGTLNFDPDVGPLAFLYHWPFVWFFARGAFAAFKLRRKHRSA